MNNVISIMGKDHIEKYLSEIKYYGYKSLVLNVIDSVYSIAAKYESTLKVVERFANKVGISVENGEYCPSQFISEYGNVEYEVLANDIFKNRQRTSAVNGILKAEAVVLFNRVLTDFKIESTNDLLDYHDKRKLLSAIATIKGQGSGITFIYLLMLSGDVNRFKPDRHIFNFFENYLGYGKLSDDELKVKFKEQLDNVREVYPKFTIIMLDNLIWKYMKNETRSSNIKHVMSESETPTRPYFMTNSNWYYFDEKKYRFFLKGDAPREAQDSYIRFYSHLFKD